MNISWLFGSKKDVQGKLFNHALSHVLYHLATDHLEYISKLDKFFQDIDYAGLCHLLKDTSDLLPIFRDFFEPVGFSCQVPEVHTLTHAIASCVSFPRTRDLHNYPCQVLWLAWVWKSSKKMAQFGNLLACLAKHLMRHACSASNTLLLLFLSMRLSFCRVLNCVIRTARHPGCDTWVEEPTSSTTTHRYNQAPQQTRDASIALH